MIFPLSNRLIFKNPIIKKKADEIMRIFSMICRYSLFTKSGWKFGPYLEEMVSDFLQIDQDRIHSLDQSETRIQANNPSKPIRD